MAQINQTQKQNDPARPSEILPSIKESTCEIMKRLAGRSLEETARKVDPKTPIRVELNDPALIKYIRADYPVGEKGDALNLLPDLAPLRDLVNQGITKLSAIQNPQAKSASTFLREQFTAPDQVAATLIDQRYTTAQELRDKADEIRKIIVQVLIRTQKTHDFGDESTKRELTDMRKRAKEITFKVSEYLAKDPQTRAQLENLKDQVQKSEASFSQALATNRPTNA